MKYLITGGCGFLGSNIASALLAEKQDVYIIDNLSRVGSDKNLEWLKGQGAFCFAQLNTWDFQAVSHFIKDVQPDIIFHLAGQVAMTTSIANPRLDFETNTLGT